MEPARPRAGLLRDMPNPTGSRAGRLQYVGFNHARNLPELAQRAKPRHRGSRMNQLAGEKSPYLLQHADNPVEWHPWGEAAFEKARRENKPIFLSIGYSTCHWCHVMAHESFENEETAALMNKEFVNIKVDREERPDVDRIYMTFVQATTGHGGWPMSVWLTPELQPFVGGTYFPPEDRYGHSGFKAVLRNIATAWRESREKVVAQGQRIVEALGEAQRSATTDEGPIDPSVFELALQQLSRGYDSEEGGFGHAPKFPHPVTLNFLSRFYAGDRRGDEGKRAQEMFLFTLEKMAVGGMHDHLGGGFHRYSVDRFWHVPHFEKMLYDQAQLALAYLDALQITGKEQYERVVRDILDYVARDMTAPEGGFFSAEDADSEAPEKRGHNVEGAFYVWSESEVDSALGDDAEVFKFFYGIESDGNAPAGSDPHGEFTGKNILIERATLSEAASKFGRPEDEIADSLGRSRQKMLKIRSRRPRPHLDDKIITAWNGLMISAYARAGAALQDENYLEAARRAATFVRMQLYDQATKILYRSYREGRSAIAGFADDYAFMIQGLLDLYEATLDSNWLRWAIELQEIQDRLFWDEKGGGYFSASANDPSLVLRMKDENDGAEPAPSSVGALNLLRLGELTDREDLRTKGGETIRAFSTVLSRFPTAMPQMLVALDFQMSPTQQIVIAGDKYARDARALLTEVHRYFLPHKVVILADDNDAVPKSEAVRQMKPVNGKAAAYVCENFTCQSPVTDPRELQQLLLP